MKSEEFYELKYPHDTLSVHTGNSEAILAVQKFLNKRGYTDALDRPLVEDGIYGPNTFNAVIKYQEGNGLFGDGIVGDKTWDSMYKTIKSEEMKAASESGNINAYYADSELNIDGMDPSMYHNTKQSNKSGGFNLGKAVKSIYDYTKANDNLPKKSYTDGWEEEKAREIEKNTENSEVVTPEGNFQNEEDTEEFIRNYGEMAAQTIGLFG